MDDLIKNARQAGITVEELASICGVSRAAVYKWNSNTKIHKLRVDRVRKIATAIKMALDSGDLPLHNGRTYRKNDKKEKEFFDIKVILARHLRSMASAT